MRPVSLECTLSAGFFFNAPPTPARQGAGFLLGYRESFRRLKLEKGGTCGYAVATRQQAKKKDLAHFCAKSLIMLVAPP